MRSEVIVSSVDVELKLNAIISRFLTEIDRNGEIIMSGYTGSVIIDENLYTHINNCIRNLKGSIDYGDNPDDVPGTNFRMMVCKLYSAITKEILQKLPLTHRIVSVSYKHKENNNFLYDVEHTEMIV